MSAVESLINFYRLVMARLKAVAVFIGIDQMRNEPTPIPPPVEVHGGAITQRTVVIDNTVKRDERPSVPAGKPPVQKMSYRTQARFYNESNISAIIRDARNHGGDDYDDIEGYFDELRRYGRLPPRASN